MRRKLTLTLIIVSVLCTCHSISAQIKERQGSLYFKLGDTEYPLNNDGRLSHNSARDILQRLRRAHQSGLNNDIGKVVFDEFHKVYRGEFFDETLLLALKIRLNKTYLYLSLPKKNYGNMKYLNGQLLYRSKGVYLKKEKDSVDHPSAQIVKHYKGTISVYLLGGKERPNVSRFSEYRPLAYNSKKPKDFLKLLSMSAEYGFKQSRDEKLQRAIHLFITEIDGLVESFHSRASSNSQVMMEDWNPLLFRIPQEAYRLRDEYGFAAADRLTSGLVTVCLDHMTKDEFRTKLLGFAKSNNISFVKSKPKSPKPF